MSIAIDNTTGSTVAIPGDAFRQQVTLRIKGDDVWVNFNEKAVTGEGVFIQEGDSARFFGERASAAVYMVTASGQAATAYLVNGYTNMEIVPGNPRESNGAIPVNIQDQHSRTFDIFFSQVTGDPTALDSDASINEYSFDAVTGHGIIAGCQVVMYDDVSDRLYVADVLSAGVNTIEIDTPLNFSYPSASSVIVCSSKELNVDGSTTRQTFAIAPPVDIDIDITRVMFQMTTEEFPELDMFGDIEGGILRGVIMRSVNGINVNYFNVKTNGELVNLMFDVSFYEAAKHGSNGLGGRLTYGGQSKHGVTIRLGKDDTLEAIIQDDLTSLLSFRMIATGHEVTD